MIQGFNDIGYSSGKMHGFSYQHIYIIGNGVIGKALAVALTNSGKKVTILRGSVDDLPDKIESTTIETGTETYQEKVNVSTLGNQDKLDGIILLTNKSFGNAILAQKLHQKAKDLPIIFLQNGLNIEQAFIDYGYTALYRCILFATSQFNKKGELRFRSVAPSPIGIITGSAEVLENIVNEINTSIFPFIAEENIQKIIWKKVITNCVFNSICPLLEIDNGVFHRNEEALQIGKQIIEECIAVAIENKIDLSVDEVLQNVVSISRSSDGQRISTYQDILQGRETEIETINLAIENVAKRTGKNTVTSTALLGQLTKIKAALFRKQ